MNIEEAYNTIESCYGFEDGTSQTGEAWSVIIKELNHLKAQKDELLEILKTSEKAIQASYDQANAEWRRFDKIENKCDEIIRDFRKRRDNAIKYFS